MTYKQQSVLNKILLAIPSDYCRGSFRDIAEYTINLGYLPTIKGARKTYADFTKSKINRTILKIDTDPKFPPRLAIKFYALPVYSGIFADAINARIAEWKRLGYKAQCFGCGKCDGTEGYTFIAQNGEQGFICGFGIIPLPTFCADNVVEVQEALRLQDEFFMKQGVNNVISNKYS